MRSYDSRSEAAFKLWKTNLKDQAYKKAILQRTIQHYYKLQWEAVKRNMRTFVSKARQQDATNEIKRKQIEQDALETTAAHGNEQQEIMKQEVEQAQEELMQEGSMKQN